MKRKPNGYWSFERLKETAAQYSSRSEFERENSAGYQTCRKVGLLNICCSHMEYLQRPNGYWNLERLKEAAAPYSSRKEFKKNSSAAYNACVRAGLIEVCCSHMKRGYGLAKRGIYIFEFEDKVCYVGLTYNFDKRYIEHTQEKGVVFNYIQQHENVVFKFKKLSEYIDPEEAAKLEAKTIEKYKLEGWLCLNKQKAGNLGGARRGEWDKESCRIEAQKYTTRSQFRREAGGVYRAAFKNGWYTEITSHMPKFIPSRPKWDTLEKVQVAALKCKSRSEFKRKNRGAYASARRNKWFTEVTSHMSERASWDTLEKVQVAALKYKTRNEFQKKSNGAYRAARRNDWMNILFSKQ